MYPHVGFETIDKPHSKVRQAIESIMKLTKPAFKIGDHVEWNSEAGHVRGTIQQKITSATKFKTYIVRASKEEPQYLIKSDKTDHMAIHKSAVLKRIRKTKEKSR